MAIRAFEHSEPQSSIQLAICQLGIHSPHEADGLTTAKTIGATLYGGTFGGVVIENPPQSKDTVARP